MWELVTGGSPEAVFLCESTGLEFPGLGTGLMPLIIQAFSVERSTVFRPLSLDSRFSAMRADVVVRPM